MGAIGLAELLIILVLAMFVYVVYRLTRGNGSK